MSAPTPLFTVPIAKCGSYPGGSIVCSEPDTNVYLLVFNSPSDNRLTTEFCKAMLAALDIIEFGYPPGVVVTTSAIPKFYSNGLDLDHATSTPGYWPNSLYAMWRRFLTYPMPTIALLNGHAFAGGLMTATHHDYRIANPQKGFLCLNELDFGAPLKPPMSSIFRQKLSAQTYRHLVLEARRFTGPAALEAGIVDGLGGLDEVLKLVRDRELIKKGKTGVYGVMKLEMWKESIALLDADKFEAEEKRWDSMMQKEDERIEVGKKFVEGWKASGKAKL